MPTVGKPPLGARVQRLQGHVKCDECGKPATTWGADYTGIFPLCKKCREKYGR
jgi:formylmethanofuran dehydrogenase subunit E